MDHNAAPGIGVVLLFGFVRSTIFRTGSDCPRVPFIIALGSGWFSMCLFQMWSNVIEKFMNDDGVSVMGRSAIDYM